MKKLDFTQSLRDSCTIGRKNAVGVTTAVALWLLTIWIPGINIGTTIAVLLLPLQLAQGTPIRPLDIFLSSHRRRMSDCFLAAGMMAVPIVLALTLVFFPGVVLLLAWSLAFCYLADRGMGPVEAIRASDRATGGSKWAMLFMRLVSAAIPAAVGALLVPLSLALDSHVALSASIFVLIVLGVGIGTVVSASFWKQLANNVE